MINTWDNGEIKEKIILENEAIFLNAYSTLEKKSWFKKMLNRESKRAHNYDLLNCINKLEQKTENNFIIAALSKCIVLALCSQELNDSSGLRYVFGNKVIQMFLNTLLNFEDEIELKNLNFKKILNTVVWKSILFLEDENIIKTKIIRNNKKKICMIEYINTNHEFNDDFRFQFEEYKYIQNILCSHESMEVGDLIICCSIYEYNVPFLIRNLRNNPSCRNNNIELFKLIYNECIIDIEEYEKNLIESENEKICIIKNLDEHIKINKKKVEKLMDQRGKLDDLSLNKEIWRTKEEIKKDAIKKETIERIIAKKKKFLRTLKDKGNVIYFMKKICFRARFYEISELSITSSKEIRYSIQYEKLSECQVEKELNEIRETKYYIELQKNIKILRLKEYYLTKFEKFAEEDILVITLAILISIGMEFKNELISSNKQPNLINFVEKGEEIIEKNINDDLTYYEEINDWEKRTYIRKLVKYIKDGDMTYGMIVNKDYSASVFFNMVRLFSDDLSLRSSFNVGWCDEWSCGYSFLIDKIKENLKEKKIMLNEEILIKKILKRAIMCQPYNVSSSSAKKYIIENLPDYGLRKEEYDETIKIIVNELKTLKKKWLFKEEFDNLSKKIIENDYILKLSDMEISMLYYKINDKKRIIFKKGNKRKTVVLFEKTDTIDLRKTRIAMCANIMHSIDSFEMRSIFKYLEKKRGKNIHAIHDCVICRIFDFFKINDIANRGLDYISLPNIKKKENIGYSIYIFS